MKIDISFEVKEETEDDNIKKIVQTLYNIAGCIDVGILGGPIPTCGSTNTISGTWGIAE